MRYRTKVLLLLMGMVVVTTGFAVALLYWHFQRVLQDQIGSQVLTATATTAAFLDGELHKQIKVGGESSQAYLILRDAIRRGRDANRRDDFSVKYAYTLTMAPGERGQIQFGVDAEEDQSAVAVIGEAYRSKLNNPFKVDLYQYDKVFTKDDWGEFLTANAPIKDQNGQVVAALGFDVESKLVKARTAVVLQIAALALGGSLLVAFAVAIILARRFTEPLNDLRTVVEAIGRGDLSARARVGSNDELGKVAAAINAMAEGLQERLKLRETIERYVPYHVVDAILKSPESPVIKGERKKITVLFSDIRGFSKIAENRQPEEVVSILNRCFELISEIVTRHHGTLDKFIGDGMMATFGAPDDDPYQEEHAIKAALEIREKSRELSEEAGTRISMGVGVNSGYAVVGSMGSSRHMEYTAIGEVVNTACCLESATKGLDVDILMSEFTHNAVRGVFDVRRLDPLEIKGHPEKLTVYSVEALRSEPSESRQ